MSDLERGLRKRIFALLSDRKDRVQQAKQGGRPRARNESKAIEKPMEAFFGNLSRLIWTKELD